MQADVEADRGDRAVGHAQERGGALQPPRQEVGVRRDAERLLELAAEVSARQSGGARHVVDLEPLREAGVREVLRPEQVASRGRVCHDFRLLRPDLAAAQASEEASLVRYHRRLAGLGAGQDRLWRLHREVVEPCFELRKLCHRRFERRPQCGRADVGVVRVRCKVVHEPACEQLMREALDRAPELTANRSGRHRRDAALLNQLFHDFRLALERGYPLGMRDQDLVAPLLQVAHHAVDKRDGTRERWLEQDESAAAQRARVQGLLGEVGDHRVRELGARPHAQWDTCLVEGRLNLAHEPGERRRVVLVPGVHVRRGDDRLDAAGNSCAPHRERGFEVRRTIVDARKQMRVQVDHGAATLASAAVRQIIINGRAAARPQITGVERWAREMARRLPELDPDRYVVMRPPTALSKRPGQDWERVLLPAAAARARAAGIYNPANLAPLAWGANVVNIHDAVALRHPEWYSATYVRWQRALMPRVARRAKVVITVSEFSRAELIEFLDVPGERIRVVPGGVDARFSAAVDVEALRARLRLSKPYVLTVGDRGPRKNLQALRPAIPLLRKHGIELVVAGGGRGHQLGAALDGARDLGYVPDEDLPALYAGARAFALPSLHEGLGLTVLEAMAAGVPVVASSRAALPEVVTGAGVLVDPDDWGQFGAAIVKAATDGQQRAELREKGREVAARYSWERAATAVHGILSRVG